MVHIKRIELTNFKSFGGTTGIPFLPGFTVVSGPNGSGKSNILDALLFALGLSSSKGMRAERLPDLVNSSQSRKTTVETRVTVTFDLSDFEGSLPNSEIIQTTDNHNNSNHNNGNRNGHENGKGIVYPELEITDALDGGALEAMDETSTPSPPKMAEWSVTRKLRVTAQNTYTSTYYINGQPCTQTELHEQLSSLRINPEGYNVVLQGDVTGIITMKSRERREIIDEMAGVAQFDRKISLAKEKLDTVKEREDRCRIVEQELVLQRDRLDRDRLKAQKYQKLRDELQQKSQWEAVLNFQTLQRQTRKLRETIEGGDRTLTDFNAQLQQKIGQIQQMTEELEALNAQVKAMGEEELLKLQSILANQDAECRQLGQRQQELQTILEQTTQQIQQTAAELQQGSQRLIGLTQEQQQARQTQERCQLHRDQLQQRLDQTRESAKAVAEQAEAWVQQQTDLHRQIEELQKSLDPQRSEQAQLGERVTQLQQQIQERQLSRHGIQINLEHQQQDWTASIQQRDSLTQQVQALAIALAQAEEELQLQQDTQARLLREQQETQRKLDKLEAQQQAQQEATGTYASKLILQTGLPGVCGLVCQLGHVDPEYQLALEIAAGGRLGQIVVEDDQVAAAGIELLKRERAGRATFLPLNKIRGNRSGLGNAAMMRSLNGFIDYAVNLIESEPRYQEIFAYVLGNTLVFDQLSNARRHLGRYRIVTLDGELLEASGAITGGSQNSRSTLHFGTAETTAAEAPQISALKRRLGEIDRILERCLQAMDRVGEIVKQRSQDLIDLRQQQRDVQQHVIQLETQIQQLTTQQQQLQTQLEKNSQEFSTSAARIQELNQTVPTQETQLNQARSRLAQLEETHRHTQWQQLQTTLRIQETELQQGETALREVENQISQLETQQHLLQEKIATGEQRLTAARQQQATLEQQQLENQQHQTQAQAEIAITRSHLTQVESQMGEEKQQRDRLETDLREQHRAQQQLQWDSQKLEETQTERRQQLVALQTQIQTAEPELPDPLPAIPEHLDLEDLQKDLRSLQKRMEALEPVNMLALEDYDRTQARLNELTEKLATLEGERTELLLRIENFTTLRQRSFQAAFDAVNQNFQIIFAELSDGDGYLQIDDPDDPFNSGLNLVAHPKGKPVQRLASMSGGEKSLTALSFIFALQRYRPSTFYAFDEVDMFLDGANVERLARMIKRQAEQAQFIVVSLRRPMMEASERTIGVTQARGAHTQVLGIQL
ncbi:MAG: chromosome segregation protein SMC [Oscillatoriales cyanobacterium RM2_1_1]|nr:chromosome segregation protein SMC [Oscillatoriales cyanobacterium SM2_3_0]NJO44768.1 chromosome segregation protein SMC [Oscillatoriales cyanobacterium RM2_1_1]